MHMEKYQRIRDLREDADLTQQQVGKAVNVPQRTYAYYESGQRMVPPHVLCALADYYKVSVDYILGRTDKNKLIGLSAAGLPIVRPAAFFTPSRAVPRHPLWWKRKRRPGRDCSRG